MVTASNVADALVALGWLSQSWPFVSGNAALIGKSVAVYGLGSGTTAFLFAGVIAWQLVATTLFWRAALEPRTASPHLSPRVLSAYGVSLAFWGALLVADEVFLVYRHGSVTFVHWCVAAVELLSLLVLTHLDDG